MSKKDDRISLQRAVECPYCKAKNRIDLEGEGNVSTSERQMGNEVLYEFEDVERQCHNCGRAFTVSKPPEHRKGQSTRGRLTYPGK